MFNSAVSTTASLNNEQVIEHDLHEMVDYGSFFNQPSRRFKNLASRVKSKVKNAFTQDRIERWFGVWDISGEVIYAELEREMEANIKADID